MAGRRLSKKDLFLLVLTLCVVVGGVYMAWSVNVDQRVFLVNALDVPTQIAVDGQTRTVGPGHVEISLHRGVHHVRVTGAGGELLEEGPIDVPSVAGAVAYNVLGAAPLYTETIIYGTGSGRNAPPTVVLHAGQRLVVSPHADFVFRAAPRSISVDKSSSSSHARLHFDMAAGGWATTTSWLHERGDSASALRICLDVARAEPSMTRATQSAARWLQELRGERIAVAYLRRALETHPDDFDLHRLHQHLMRRAGHLDEARAFYRSYRDERPTSPLAAVLLARLEGPDPAADLYHEALALDPKNLPARRGLAQLLFDRGRFSESVRLFDEVAHGDPDYKYVVQDHVRALLIQGEAAKAVTVAAAAAKKAPKEWSLAVLYAEVADTEGVVPTVPAQQFVDGLSQTSRDPEFGMWMRSLAGLPVNLQALKAAQLRGSLVADAAAVQLAAQKDPAEAWALVARAKPGVVDELAGPVALLLAAEFFRVGDTRTADDLFASRNDMALPAEELKAFVANGTEHPDFWRMPTDVRAVLEFVRARKLQADGAADPRAYEAATRREAYRGLVGRSLRSWPAPERTRPQPSLALQRRPAL
ncbi:MAG TPA: tetratricopeptide repeat protein [Vicinamibacteria bacterium]|nr:tetratricopeptide repeat protein [Vicinamibacteria bacterium]